MGFHLPPKTMPNEPFPRREEGKGSTRSSFHGMAVNEEEEDMMDTLEREIADAAAMEEESMVLVTVAVGVVPRVDESKGW